MKNVEDDSGSLILGVNYSNFLQLISTLCDSAVTMLSLCELWSEAPQWRLLWAAWKTSIKAGQLHQSLKLDFAKPKFKSLLRTCLPLMVNRPNPVLCLPGMDERSGPSPWGPAQQNSPSFNQGRVWFILTYYIESGLVDVILLSLSETQQKFGWFIPLFTHKHSVWYGMMKFLTCIILIHFTVKTRLRS